MKIQAIISEDRPEKFHEHYLKVRALTASLCQALQLEDFCIQAMPDVSPPKWHLAHTTWFFETFLLIPYLKNYQPFDPQFGFLFNSYYKGVGAHHPRFARGLLFRPTTEEIFRYRHDVDVAIAKLCDQGPLDKELETLFELGLHHEQQHQELLLMDIQYNFFSNPLRPAYLAKKNIEIDEKLEPPPLQWLDYPEGIYRIGSDEVDFSFDNEKPQHRVFLENFRMASRPICNREYLEFIQDGAYQNPLLWLSDGWDLVQHESWKAPLYWEKREDTWWQMTLSGMQKLNLAAPVSHLSYYEADAYAHWADKRLPREAEWEVAAQNVPIEGNFLESAALQTQALHGSSFSKHPQQMFGDVWEWTQSPYVAYPGFRPLSGAVGEYNGKFMCNQIVLRGGSYLTPQSHLRKSYRNFYPPQARWQCAGLRLAEDGR